MLSAQKAQGLTVIWIMTYIKNNLFCLYLRPDFQKLSLSCCFICYCNCRAFGILKLKQAMWQVWMKGRTFARTSSTFQENNNQVSDPLCPYIDVYCCLVILLSFPVKTLNCPRVCIFVHTVETELLRWFMQERAQNIRKSERRRKGHFSEDLVLDCETIF